MSAGYCWQWTTKITPDMTTLPADVVIGQWSRPWNLYGDRSALGAPVAPLWATDPAGFGQVGYVYTAQGFEYDWSGVIIGPDLVWRRDRWVVIRSASKDPSFTKATPDDDVDRLIRNTYKVLLTPGLRRSRLTSVFVIMRGRGARAGGGRHVRCGGGGGRRCS